MWPCRRLCLRQPSASRLGPEISRGGRSWPGSPTPRFRCLFVLRTNGSSRVTIEFGLHHRGDLATAPASHRIAPVAVCRARVYYLTDVLYMLLLCAHIVCVGVCVRASVCVSVF